MLPHSISFRAFPILSTSYFLNQGLLFPWALLSGVLTSSLLILTLSLSWDVFPHFTSFEGWRPSWQVDIPQVSQLYSNGLLSGCPWAARTHNSFEWGTVGGSPHFILWACWHCEQLSVSLSFLPTGSISKCYMHIQQCSLSYFSLMGIKNTHQGENTLHRCEIIYTFFSF